MSDPAEGDSWWSADNDNDALTNAQEVSFGSDPYALDSDRDGLTDYVEYLCSQAALGAGTALPFDPWLWDSNANGFSDFDEYYQQIQSYQPVVNYTSLPAGATWAAGTFYTFSDADGDGIINPEDSDPLNMDRDGDGILNWIDIGNMDDASNGTVVSNNSSATDSDGDGIPDSSDPFPNGSFKYDNLEYPGTWSDRDGDHIPDAADSYPDDPTNGYGYNFNGVWYNQTWSDVDGDNIPDPADSYPDDPTNGTGYNYNGSWYAGPWSDRDGDGIPDPADGWPDDFYNGTGTPDPTSTGYSYNGTWYSGDWVDSDNDGIPDPADSYPNDPNNGGYTYNGTWYYGTWMDSDGDGIPDPADGYPYDYYNGMGTPAPTGYSYNGTWYYGTWMDGDGDGIPDPADSYPNDPNNGGYTYNGTWYYGTWMDSDGDGIPDPADSYPYDYYNGTGTPASTGYNYNGTWYSGDWVDSDNDGIPDPADSYPNDPNNGGFYYNGNWYQGGWSDSDGDGIPDVADSYPYDSNNGMGFSYGGMWYSGSWVDSDGDGIPDQADSYPSDANNGSGYYYNGNWYSGSWVDSDYDGIPDPADSYPYDPTNSAGYGYDYNGTWYYGAWTDTDGDGIPDPADNYPYDANNGGFYYGGTWYYGSPYDTDGDGIPDIADPYPDDINNNQFNYNGTWYTGQWVDYDGDGIPDQADNWPADPENGANNDGDGLSNYDERTTYGTNPDNPDTDGDLLNDYEELFTWHTNPLLAKTDPNQLYPDYDMVDHTDADSDGIPDRIELYYGMNPNDANDAQGDLDGDGYTNLEAYQNGWNFMADLEHYDSDGDGILDVLEDAWSAKYPGILSKTCFNDSVQDYDGDGVMNFEEVAAGLNPGSPNSRNPAVSDLQEWTWRKALLTAPAGSPWLVKEDTNHNGVSDGLETFIAAGTVPLLQRVSVDDCDGDGMPDLWEHHYGLKLRDASDVIMDPDLDRLTNLVEYRFGSNPLVSDTNHDNVDDGSRLYNTSITPRDLHGLTMRYQAQQVADYTRTATVDASSFTAYADGGSEEPSPPGPEVEEIVKVQMRAYPHPSGATPSQEWVLGSSISAHSQSEADAFDPPPYTATIEDGHWGAQPLYPEQYDENGQIIYEEPRWVVDGSHTEVLDPDPGTWYTEDAGVQVELSGTDRLNDHKFTFKVTTGLGDEVGVGGTSEDITLTIPKGSAADTKKHFIKMAPQGGWVTIEPSTEEPIPDPDPINVSISASDGAGPLYRKVSLAGVPLADSKPQVQDESGERPEETYIDAYDRTLRHGVTDIYASDPSTLLPLSLRRDTTSDPWTRVSGLRPSERPDLPFGPGWSSNICAFVRYQTSTRSQKLTAEVHDEQGATQRFESRKGTPGWHHTKEELSNAQTRANTFDGLVLHKKFGTTCFYTMCSFAQTIPADRLRGSEEMVTYTYARLSEVRDRLGNRLLYEYSSGASLIPSRVYDPDRPGRQIYVLHANGRISAVRGPAGEEVAYENFTEGLRTVTRGNTQVKYAYQTASEAQPNPSGDANQAALNALEAYVHTNVASITDERDNTYQFAYEFNQSQKQLSASSDGSQAKETLRLGLPMMVTQVTLPDGSQVHLGRLGSTQMSVGAGGNLTFPPGTTTQVNGPAGSFVYAFSNPVSQTSGLDGAGAEEGSISINTIVTYCTLMISSAAGTETYRLNPDAMFALSSATDISGNMHSFIYDADGFNDPIRETDALGNFKDFTYDATTRVMTSMTDQTGVVTSYQIQPVTGLKLSETVTGMDGLVKRQSAYQYNHPTFRGFMTQSTVDASADDTAPATVTTYSLGSGDMGWAEVTESTATATGAVSSTTVHDLSGNKRSVIDGRGMVTNFAYDEHLRLTQVTHPDNSHKNLVYDLHGNLVQEINENGNSVFHGYDVFNRRTKTTVDLNGNGVADESYGTSVPSVSGDTVSYGGDIVTTTTYNARGQVLTQTDARGKVTTNAYDGAGRLIRTDDGGLVTTMEYSTEPGANTGGGVFDSSGFKPSKITDPRGTVTMLTHDKMYRTTAQTVIYDNVGPTSHVLKSLAETASLAYTQANSVSVLADAVLQMATAAVERAAFLLDLPAVQAVKDAAVATLQAANDALPEKIAAVGPAQQAVDDATAAVANAQTMANAAVTAALQGIAEAQQASADAIGAYNSAVSAIQSARDANDTAQQNVVTLAAALEEVVAQAADRASELEAAPDGIIAAQAALDSVTMNMATAISDEDAAFWAAQIPAAAAALTAAQAGLTTAQAAKTSADAAVVAATAAANAAASAAAEAASALAMVQGTDLNALQTAADQGQMNIANAQMAYDDAVANAPNVLADLEAELAAKSQLLSAALGSESVAEQAVVTAQNALDAANADLTIAQNAVDDPDAMAALQADLAAAQGVKDGAAADLAAKEAVTAAKLALSTAAQQRWNGVRLRMGDMTLHTATTSTVYDAAGRPTQVTDALGRVALTVYDVFGQIQQVTHPDGSVVRTAYTHHGKPWKVVDELGNVTTTEFDAAGRAVRSIAPAVGGVSATTSTGYDAAGNVVRVTDPLGHVTESQYNERNRAVAVYAPPVWDAVSGEFVRPLTQSTYDALGQVVTVTDPQGHVTTKLYDRAGRNWKVKAPAVGGVSPATRTKFDPGGLALVVTNPLGQSVTNTYDVHGRLTQTTDAAGIVNTFGYDAVGNRTSVKDGKNQETQFGYDGLNRLSWQVFANGDTTTQVYDAVRKLTQTTPRGITTSYTYDSRDRVVGSSAPGITRTHGYDAAGRLMNVTEAENPAASVAYTYDALGRVTSETSRGVTHSYSYDLAGNRVRADYGTGSSVQTGYDALNRPELISEGGRVTRYGYDVVGRAVMLVAGNGQTSQNSYDALGRLVARTLFKTPAMGSNEVLAEFNWTHDLLGNVKQQLETWPGDANRSAGVRSTTMTYDADNRLSTETVVEPTAVATTTAYEYDAANNRLQKTVTGGSDPGVWHYLYNAVNQLMGWEQRDVQDSVLLKSATLAYDEAGNRVSQTVEGGSGGSGGSGINPPPAAGGTTTYQWDAQDRLSSVTLPDGQTHAYDYDYRTRRIGTQKFAGAVRQSLTAIVFAGGLSLAEWDSTTDSLPPSPSVEYMRGPDMGGGVGGMLYSMRASGTKYSLSNGRGDIVAQADSTATLTWTASYEAYGRRTTETGSNADKQRGNSKDEDPTGLLNEGFRYRDLETGVWLSRDPAGFVDGPNVYAYVKQNPWSMFDAHGLSGDKLSLEGPAYIIDFCFSVVGGYAAGKNPLAQAQYQKAPWKPLDAIFNYSGNRGKSDSSNEAVKARAEAQLALNTLVELKATVPKNGNAPKIESTPKPPKGSNNSNTQNSALRGTQLHQDRPGNLPDQLRQMYPATILEFTKQGAPGQDVKVGGGQHPSTYPGSTWAPGINFGDFKPGTPGGWKTFVRDQNVKWKDPTMMIPYDSSAGKIKVPFRPPPEKKTP